jgi:hypothetical protein
LPQCMHSCCYCAAQDFTYLVVNLLFLPAVLIRLHGHLSSLGSEAATIVTLHLSSLFALLALRLGQASSLVPI